MNCYCCFDLGGTTINCSVLQEDGVVLDFLVLPSKNEKEYILHELETYINKSKENYTIEGIAFSTPGIVNSEIGIIQGFSALSSIHNFNFKEHFQELFSFPVSIENDANCALLGELFTGYAKEVNNAVLISVGTGIGGSVMINQKILKGSRNFAGEFGYMILNSEDNQYYSLNELSSVSSLIRNMNKTEYKVKEGKEVFELAEQGNDEAKTVIQNFYKYLSLGIFNAHFSISPDIILISGGVSEREELSDVLQETVYQMMDAAAERFLGQKVRLEWLYPIIKSCKNGNQANVIGALKHLLDEYHLS
ncbi:ROK family protein [Breznakia pachnodae]|uniref:NBD/HSP70 family sugar kinase n=1 Tax=Breznakia pachnodae TaxID=265178 RepID=A0ABU0E081_9FIRM|nr:ROK family protein [Breznakia pachnodae]MDQ0360294.1 putative NBD/HSP70 family sugar kinase [Breznakia pachnodae]